MAAYYSTTAQRMAAYYSTVQHITAPQHSAWQHSTAQHSFSQHSAWQHFTAQFSGSARVSTTPLPNISFPTLSVPSGSNGVACSCSRWLHLPPYRCSSSCLGLLCGRRQSRWPLAHHQMHSARSQLQLTLRPSWWTTITVPASLQSQFRNSTGGHVL